MGASRQARAWKPVLAATVAGTCLAVALWRFLAGAPPATPSEWMDLQVYQGAVRSMLGGQGLYSYAYFDPAGDPATFLYPPFAALALLPLAWLSPEIAGALWFVLQLAMLGVLVWSLARVEPSGATAGPPLTPGPWRAATPAALAFLVLAVSGPVSSSLILGQLSLLIALLCVLDVAVLPTRWRGLLIGLAAALKLTPLFFLPYFVLTRQWRAARNAVVVFGAAAVVGLVLAPKESAEYWGGVVFDTSRVPGLSSVRNLSLLGVLGSWGLSGPLLHQAWLACAVAVAALGLWRAGRHFRRGEEVAAAIVVGGTAAIAGPVAWDHALVWLPIAGFYVAASARRTVRGAAWVFLCCLPFFLPVWPRGEDPGVLWRVLGVMPTVLVVLLAAAGLPRAAARPQGPSAGRPGTAEQPAPAEGQDAARLG